jgi:phage-related protein
VEDIEMLRLYEDLGLLYPLSTGDNSNTDVATGLTDTGFTSLKALYLANLGGTQLTTAYITSNGNNSRITIDYSLDYGGAPGAYSTTLNLPVIGAAGSGIDVVKIWRRVRVTAGSNLRQSNAKHKLYTSSVDLTPTLVDSLQIAWNCILIDNVDLGAIGCSLSPYTTVDLLPPTDIRKTNVGGRHGSQIVGAKRKIRMLELEIDIMADSLSQMLSVEQTLRQTFDPIKGYQDVVLEIFPNKVYQAKYSGQTSLKDWIQDGHVTIPMKTQDPYIYSVLKKTSGVGTMINNGTEETPLYIEVVGPATSPSVGIGPNTISYTGTVSSGQILILDGNTMEAKIGSTNVLDNVTGNMPVLVPGVNIITCSSGTVNFRWRERGLV